MRSRFAAWAVLLLLVAAQTVAQAAEPLYEVLVGSRPLPRPLTFEEHETFIRLRNFGVIKKLPDTIQDPANAELIELPPASVAAALGSLGGSLEKLPSPSGMTATASPGYSARLKENHAVAYARCQFEVLPDGTVGRIYTTHFSHREFVLDCGRALKQWRFAPAPLPRHFQILFEAHP